MDTELEQRLKQLEEKQSNIINLLDKINVQTTPQQNESIEKTDFFSEYMTESKQFMKK